MEKTFGFREFRPGQADIMEAVLDGADALVIMPTGGGKSLCYQVPAFVRAGTTLVISPLIALMKDQVDSLRVRDLPVIAVHSLMSSKEQEEALCAISEGRMRLVYASPERLRNRRFLDILGRNRVAMVAVDEAHCISQWGHDFRPDYLRIREAIQALGDPQTIALTATATERVRSDITNQLGLRAPRVFITGFDRRNLFWEVIRCADEKEKTVHLTNRLAALSGAAIVYTGTRKNVERIVQDLAAAGLTAAGYHAGLEEAERTRVQEDFMEGRIPFVAATNAFGMGIDRSDIRMVVHHTFPGSIEAYYQESGRAGRDGEPATCLLLYTPSDRRLQEFFIDARYPPRETVSAVYEALRSRPEDILWRTYREIGAMAGEQVPEPAVGACLKILEDAGAVERLHRYDNRAEIYLQEHPGRLLKQLRAQARVQRKLVEVLIARHGEERLRKGVQFLPEQLAGEASISVEALRRSLSELQSAGRITYIPPFRGRGVRVRKRIAFEKLGIDFQALKMKKAYELSRLDRVMAYATTPGCRRKHLLSYFGDIHPDGPCGACDRCVGAAGADKQEETFSDPVLAVKILSGVARLKGRFGMGMAAKVLTGSTDRTLLGFGLQRLSTYGLLSGNTREQVQGWIRDLTAAGCLASRTVTRGERRYPVIELTDRGRRVMAGREEIRLAIPRKAASAPPSADPLPDAAGKEAFQELRELRARIARKEQLPAYCIFHDRTLREMARILPRNEAEMLGVMGVGEVTLKKYGKRFLELTARIRARLTAPDQGKTPGPGNKRPR